MGKQDIWQP